METTNTFSVKSANGKMDVYGIMFTPTNLDPNRKYPVVDYIYPGRRVEVLVAGALVPQEGITRHWRIRICCCTDRRHGQS
jgi:hypothetical protein